MEKLLISIVDSLVDWGKKCPPGYAVGFLAHHGIEALYRRIDRWFWNSGWAWANDHRHQRTPYY